MGSNNSRHLDPSDANFVDVIHTGAGVLGQWGPNGHADYYVNGVYLQVIYKCMRNLPHSLPRCIC